MSFVRRHRRHRPARPAAELPDVAALVRSGRYAVEAEQDEDGGASFDLVPRDGRGPHFTVLVHPDLDDLAAAVG